MIRVNNIQANLNVDLAGLKEIVSIKTGLDPEYIKSVKIAKKSVDARNKGNVHFVYSLDMEVWVTKIILRRFWPGKILN